MPNLTDPIALGAITAPNRIFMSPLTRGRATRQAVPTPLMADYYRQRASAGLIVTEATGISRIALGWPYAPGIWSAEQVAMWRHVTKAVHEAGGRIVSQLWHMGRLGTYEVNGGQPVSSSPTTAPGHAHVYAGSAPYPEARALALEEIPGLLDDYARAADNALAAGFDGVQLHAANGYLIDQFLRDGVNARDDGYGGAPENRIRLMVEVMARVIAEAGAGRTAIRLSPNGDTQGTASACWARSPIGWGRRAAAIGSACGSPPTGRCRASTTAIPRPCSPPRRSGSTRPALPGWSCAARA